MGSVEEEKDGEEEEEEVEEEEKDQQDFWGQLQRSPRVKPDEESTTDSAYLFTQRR